MKAIDLTASSIKALQHEYETIANNLANVSTPSFKRCVNGFSRIMQSMNNSDVTNVTSDGQINTSTSIDHTQGPIVATGRPLDVAINGQGLLVVETKDGRLYTRNGQLFVNDKGQLVDYKGKLISGEFGPIAIPAQVSQSEINITSDGTVKAKGVILGKMRLVEFPEKMTDLRLMGEGYYSIDPEIRLKPAKDAFLKQGFQENSNVNMMEELVGLITVTRMYEANMKILSKQSEDNGRILDVAMG